MKKILAIIIIILTISLLTTSVFAHRYHHRRSHNNGILVGVLGGILLGNMFVRHDKSYNRNYYRYRNICTYEREVYEIDEYGDRSYLGTETFRDYCR